MPGFGADFDEAPDGRAVGDDAVLVAQHLGDFAIALATAAQIADQIRERPKLALEWFSAR